MKISIIDFGLGNIKSIQNMILKVGGQCEIIRSPQELRNVEKIVLPGVGNFDFGMRLLYGGGWIEELNHTVIQQKVPVLGICLGMQMMCNFSEEGNMLGLGWIDAEVKLIKGSASNSLKVPHMGWNTVRIIRPNQIIYQNLATECRFYFVHSYHVVCKEVDNVLATTNYGEDIVVGIHKENIYGVQFHPEKSHRFGFDLFHRFLKV